MTEQDQNHRASPDEPTAPNRRRFIRGSAITAAGVAVGAAAGFGISAAARDEDPAVAPAANGSTPAVTTTATVPADPIAEYETARASRIVPFYGARQAGITTAQQDRMMFAAFDLTSTDKDEVARMLGRWSAIAARFTEGKAVTDATIRPGQPPFDTGETMDLGPYGLTITVGFGASMFDDRFGLADKMPAALQPLGPIAGDQAINPAISDGDLCIQACADDPQVVFHAIRNMSRAARGVAVLRWSQLGFGRASATGAGQTTPRNLFGFKDGTNNIHADDETGLDEHVWVGEETDQDWMTDGSYLVVRKIRMEIETWDADFLADQELIFARHKNTGAPLTGGTEFTPLDFAAKDEAGELVINPASHTHLSSPEANGGVKILRRGYNYTDGQSARTGKLDAGLFFICFQKNPQTQFKVIQNKLGSMDLMNEYIAHIGTGVFAVPPGVVKAGDWFGKSLFG